MPCRPFPGASPTCLWPARGGYTDSLFLPFARLRLITFLPPLVAIRTRKPCVRFLLVLLNVVNVFFIFFAPVRFNKPRYKP